MIFPPTDWLDFVATEYDVGAPATSLSFERWFRNPVAIAQGAAGAQRVVADASADSVAGPTLLFRSAKYDATTTWGLVPGSLFRATTSCQVRVTAFRFAFSGSINYRITKNGTAVVSGTASDASITADIALVAGDVVMVEGKLDLTGTPSLTIYAEYSTGDLRAVGGI